MKKVVWFQCEGIEDVYVMKPRTNNIYLKLRFNENQFTKLKEAINENKHGQKIIISFSDDQFIERVTG